MKAYRTDNIGTLCKICTGCGRCPGVTPQDKRDIDIITGSEETEKKVSLGLYLITADIGTTTVAMKLYDKEDNYLEKYVFVNPQTAYGADVLSRIKLCEDIDTAKELTRLIRDAISDGIEFFRSKLSRDTGDEKFLFSSGNSRLIIAANTTMVYLFMGRDEGYEPDELGKAPFTASKLSEVEKELDFNENKIPTVIFPGLSAFVGGDIVAGIYKTDVIKSKKPVLFIDLGTNGEMAIGNANRLIATATAAGPAFEGGPNRGIWGADMISFVARLRREGYVDETGLLSDEYFESGIRIGNVNITQDSIRAIQLAKAAVRAGIEILIREYGISYGEIEGVCLAGGFGYYLDPADAAYIGLIPDELAEKAVSAGNTALSGAHRLGEELALYGAIDILKKALPVNREVINLANIENFNDIYIDNMDFK
ncbi:MAG: DUF4445 domain-containing protein [Lachnospiraceae bacterium]|nr:DUF4445 domain-containing protein [Lachnospiraceae bacterium]